MQVAIWAEIRRLHEIERLSHRAIARRLRCSRHTVQAALKQEQPPGSHSTTAQQQATPASKLDAYKDRIAQWLKTTPELSSVRILEELRKIGYPGGITILKDWLCKIRPHHARVYQEVDHPPGDAMQVDWGDCGTIRIGQTTRRVYVFVAVLCYSRLIYIEFTLSQAKGHFYRSLRHALEFFGGSPRRCIVDNLRAAVVAGSGHTCCFHPEFIALCAHYAMQPVACARRDPESKGITENGVRYVKYNALAGRTLERFCDFQELATFWRDQVANVRIHRTTGERPVDRHQGETLRALPALPPDTDETCYVRVTSHARVQFDANRYSVPPAAIGKQVLIRADDHTIRVLDEGREIAEHRRSYERAQLIVADAHRQAAVDLRRRVTPAAVEASFDLLGPTAKEFRKGLNQQPVKPLVQLRRLLQLAAVYGRTEIRAALETALTHQTFDAAYVENLIHQQRRRRQLPSPLPIAPIRRDLLEKFEEQPWDLTAYDDCLEEGTEP